MQALDKFFSRPSFWVPDRFTPSAWLEHAPFAFWLIDAQRPRIVVELGTHHGYSFLSFCQAIKTLDYPAKAFAIDTWQGDEHAGYYDQKVYEELSGYHGPHYSHFSELIRATFDQAVEKFEDGSIDLLHIDGMHFYESVRHDFETWRSKLSSRAIVLFHDTNVREKQFGVFRFWEEIQARHPGFEFFHGNGLGVLGYGSAIPENVKPLFDAERDVTELVRLGYARLGLGCTALQGRHEAETELVQRNDDIARLEIRRHEAETQLVQRNDDIARLEIRRREAETELVQRNTELVQRNDDIARLEIRRREAETELVQRNTELVQRNDDIARLEIRRREAETELVQRNDDIARLLNDLEEFAEIERNQFDAISKLTADLAVSSSLRGALRALPAIIVRAVGIRLGQEDVDSKRRWEAATIRESGLFDEAWYAAKYPESAASGLSPVVHYLRAGAQKGYNPHCLFDGNWYLKRYPAADRSGISPLAVYLRSGVQKMHSPHPLFDTEWYLKQYPDVEATGVEPLRHYLLHGRLEGRNPNPLFDSNWYLQKHPDVFESPLNPLVHYAMRGWCENRETHPRFTRRQLKSNLPSISSRVDPLRYALEFLSAAEISRLSGE